MARANGYAKRFPGAVVWPGKKWEISLFLTETNQEKPNYTQLDERASWFYEAVGVTEGMIVRTVGAGQVYLESQKDSTGAWLDGGALPRTPRNWRHRTSMFSCVGSAPTLVKAISIYLSGSPKPSAPALVIIGSQTLR
jgi:hypothetical protein